MGADFTADLIRIFPLLNGGLLVTLITIFLKNRFENRKLTVEENAGLRKEFIDEMHALRKEVRDLRRENDQLRDEVRGLHGVIDGMRRENLTGQLTAQRVMAENMPQTPAMDRALKKLGEVQGDAG